MNLFIELVFKIFKLSLLFENHLNTKRDITKKITRLIKEKKSSVNRTDEKIYISELNLKRIV